MLVVKELWPAVSSVLALIHPNSQQTFPLEYPNVQFLFPEQQMPRYLNALFHSVTPTMPGLNFVHRFQNDVAFLQ